MTHQSIPTEYLQDVARAINEVVGYFARRTRYWCDERDIAQRAWVVAMENVSTWQPAKGPLVPYLAVILRRQLGRALMKEHSPVSAPRGAPWEALYHARGVCLDRLAEVVPTTSQPSGGESPHLERSPAEASECHKPWLDEVYADEDWSLRVQNRLAEVVGGEGQDGLADLLRDEPRPAASGRPPDRLSRSRAVACVAIAQDAQLREMLRERG